MKKYALIKKLRLNLELTQEQWAKVLKVAQTSIASWETGRRSPSVPHAAAIIDFCKKRGIKVTFDDILAG